VHRQIPRFVEHKLLIAQARLIEIEVDELVNGGALAALLVDVDEERAAQRLIDERQDRVYRGQDALALAALVL
jgi:hypothetical protein